MNKPHSKPLALIFDPLGGLTCIGYPDGTALTGKYLADYDAYMAEKFGDRWQHEKATLRLCHFDENTKPAPIDRYEPGSGMDPKDFFSVYVTDENHDLVAIWLRDGTEITGQAIAEYSRMSEEKNGESWAANRHKLKARRVDSPNDEPRGLPE